MGENCSFRYFLSLLFLLMLFVVVSAEYSPPSFGFKKFDRNSEYFRSQISLVGDARVDENGSFVQYSSGKILYKKPIKLYEGNPRKKASFGTYFVFSETGDGIAFVMLRNGFDVGFGVEVGGTKVDPISGDFRGVHVRVKVGGHVSVKVMNASDLKLKLKTGEKLQCWIDFEASSKRVEVRVNKWGEQRPVNPSISHQIDLSSVFDKEEVFVALTSSNTNTNTTQNCKLYSWSFKLRQVPTWMHSQPLDPEGFKKDAEPVVVAEGGMHKRSDCVLRLVTALVFGTGCGAMGALIVLCAWSLIVTKKPVAPEEYAVQPVVFDYEKFKVVVIDKFNSGSRK